MPSFLDDPDPTIDYLDDPDGQMLGPDGRPLPRPGTPPPPVTTMPPAMHPVGAGDQPTIRELIAQSEPELPQESPDQAAQRVAMKTASTAQQHAADVMGQKPVRPEPKWWQRVAAGAVGGLAGLSNASGTRAATIDPTAAVQNIYGAPEFNRQTAQWQNQATQAQAGVDTAQANLSTLERMRQLKTAEQRAASDEEEKRARAQKESEANAMAERTRTYAQNEKLEAAMLKPWGEDAQLQKESDPVPPGMETTQSLTQPGMVYIHPPKMVPLPEALADYAPGRKVGEQIPYSEFKKAQQRANDDLIKNTNKPDPAAKENENQWIADANSPDPKVAAAAKAKLGLLAQQRAAMRPINNNNFSIPGLTNPNASQSKLTGPDYIASLPSATANQIKAIAEGRATLPSASTRSQAAQEIRQAVFQYDPEFSEQRAQVRKSFTTGPDGRNIGALNTAPVHLDQLFDAAKAMQNGSFVPGNEIYNRVRAAFGSSAPTNFAQLKAAVAGEMASALKGNATDPEIATISENLKSAGSPQQLADGIDTNLHILGAKLNTYQERYKQQIPGDSVWNPILPSARAVFAKHGFDPTQAAAPTQSNGGGRGNANAAATPPIPASIPAKFQSTAHYSPSTKSWYYSTDGERTWQTATQ